MTINWLHWPKVQDVESGNTLYADIINHCKDYKNFIEPSSKATSAHECTHGCNSDIRNAQHGRYGYKQEEIYVDRLGKPHRKTRQSFARINGFYLGKDRAIVLNEPEIHKSDIAEYIPSELRSGRYDLYVAGQHDWDDCPLYIYDEGVAYINGAWAQYDLIKANEVDHKDRIIDGHVEFITYMTAVMMAADAKNTLQAPLIDFSKWLFKHAFNVYFLGKGVFPDFDMQDKLYEELRNGNSAERIRSFLKDKVGYTIPTQAEDEDDGGGKLNPDDFHLG